MLRMGQRLRQAAEAKAAARIEYRRLYEVRSAGLDIVKELTRRVRLGAAETLKGVLEGLMRPDAELDRKEQVIQKNSTLILALSLSLKSSFDYMQSESLSSRSVPP